MLAGLLRVRVSLAVWGERHRDLPHRTACEVRDELGGAAIWPGPAPGRSGWRRSRV